MKKMLRSIRSFVSAKLDDPKLILERNIRKMNDRIPAMNEKIEALKLNKGKDEESRELYNAALEEKKQLMKACQVEINEAKEMLRAQERKKWQAKINTTLLSFPLQTKKQDALNTKYSLKVKTFETQVDTQLNRLAAGESISDKQLRIPKWSINVGELLEKNIRDMNENIPLINEQIATIKASVSLLKKDLKLTPNDEKLIDQVQSAESRYRESLEIKTTFMRLQQNSINQAKELLREMEMLKAIREWILLARKKDKNPEEQEENFEKIRAYHSLLEKELTRYQAEHQDLIKKTASSEKAGRLDITKNYQLRIESVSFHLDRTQKRVDKLKEVRDLMGLNP